MRNGLRCDAKRVDGLFKKEEAVCTCNEGSCSVSW